MLAKFKVSKPKLKDIIQKLTNISYAKFYRPLFCYFVFNSIVLLHYIVIFQYSYWLTSNVKMLIYESIYHHHYILDKYIRWFLD